MDKISIRRIMRAVMKDNHEDVPSRIIYEGEEYYRTSSMINYENVRTGKLLKVNLLDLHYNYDAEVVDTQAKIQDKEEEIERLEDKIELLRKEISQLEDEDC